LMITD